MKVLGIRGEYIRDLEKELLEKNELLRPGFVSRFLTSYAPMRLSTCFVR